MSNAFYRKDKTYFCDGELVFSIGYAHFYKAKSPLAPHVHNNMTEFVYLERGSQRYQIGDRSYLVGQGEFFFTRPDELHDTGSSPEEKSAIYYMSVNWNLVEKMHVFMAEEEYARCRSMFGSCPPENGEGTDERVIRASAALPGALKQLVKAFSGKSPYSDTRIRNALSEVLIAFMEPYSEEKPERSNSFSKSLEYIEKHLEETVRVSDLASLEHLSLSAFHKAFTQTVGLPPAEYVLKQKIEKTKLLLQEKSLSVTEIAYRYGFSSGQYFATVFKRFCNMTPTQYRNQIRREESAEQNK